MNTVDQVRWAHGCEHPIVLRGSVARRNPTTGTTDHWSTEALPNGVAYVACKNRRKTRCGPCSWLYQGDAYQLIAAGLRGGKGISESVGSHPALFVTFTAPGFGPTHGTRDASACHPRRDDAQCPHGKSLACWTKHANDDEILGQPLCAECFDYEGAVLWNAHASALWRATRTGIERSLAKLVAVPVRDLRSVVRTEYVRVAEFQKRGLVHFHVAIRLDGVDGDPPPAMCTTEVLSQAIEQAAKTAGAPLPNSTRARWGTQLDISPITADGDDIGQSLSRGAAAGYLAKYATKGTDVTGVLDRRIYAHELNRIDRLGLNGHLMKMVQVAWGLDDEHPGLGVGSWSHQLGFPGHFCTKSQGWSTTFSALREERATYLHEQRPSPLQQTGDEIVVYAHWRFVGRGYQSPLASYVAEWLRDRSTRQRTAQRRAA